MTNKEIGTIGEAKALAKFTQLGIPVYLPFGDNTKSDMIIDLNKKLLRVQIKTCEKVSNDGSIHFRCRYTPNCRKNIQAFYKPDEVDYFVFYSLELDKLFLVKFEECKKCFNLRVSSSRNSQKRGIHLMEDFLLENRILCVETLHDEPKE